jgi:hypothetical protein
MKHKHPDRHAGADYPETDGCEGEGIWQTKDMQEIVTLLALGHKSIQNGIVQVDGTVWFCFNTNDIAQDLLLYTSGRPLMVEVHDLWRNYVEFKFLMRQMSDRRE